MKIRVTPERNTRLLTSFLVVASLMLFPGAKQASAKAEHVLRIATLAPEGSVWMNAMGAILKHVEEKSEGRIRVKVYGSGIMGDEPDVFRKMKLGLIDGSAVTLYGIWVACPEFLVTELPLLFGDRDVGEANYFQEKMARAFDPYAEAHGYKMITLTTAGFAHICSQQPLNNIISDLPKQKFWQWEGEPVMMELSKVLGVTPIPLPLTDAVTGLQTGMINAYYGSPLHILGVRWASYTNYIYRPSIFYAPACLVFTLESWNKLPPDLQALFFDEEVEKIKVDVIKDLHKADDEALEVLKKAGVEVVDIPPEQLKVIRERTRQVWANLTGKLYPQELLDRVTALLEDYRQ